MEFILTNVSLDDLDILDREGFDWYPDSLDSNDVVIECSEEEFYRISFLLGME